MTITNCPGRAARAIIGWRTSSRYVTSEKSSRRTISKFDMGTLSIRQPALALGAGRTRRMLTRRKPGDESRSGGAVGFRVGPAPGAGRQPLETEPPEGAPLERLDPVAGGCDHPLDLVVLAFDQRQAQGAFAGRFAGSGADRLVVVMEQHAGAQPLDLAGIDRVLAGHFVDLGHVMLRGRQAMHQRAI